MERILQKYGQRRGSRALQALMRPARRIHKVKRKRAGTVVLYVNRYNIIMKQEVLEDETERNQ